MHIAFLLTKEINWTWKNQVKPHKSKFEVENKPSRTLSESEQPTNSKLKSGALHRGEAELHKQARTRQKSSFIKWKKRYNKPRISKTLLRMVFETATSLSRTNRPLGQEHLTNGIQWSQTKQLHMLTNCQGDAAKGVPNTNRPNFSSSSFEYNKLMASTLILIVINWKALSRFMYYFRISKNCSILTKKNFSVDLMNLKCINCLIFYYSNAKAHDIKKP